MSYTHIKIEAIPDTMDKVLDEKSEYNRLVNTQRNLALAAPELYRVLRIIASCTDALVPQEHQLTREEIAVLARAAIHNLEVRV
jgi:hypothetical protein